MERDPVDFDLIEQQKENIEPIKEGRSAKALKELYTQSHNQLKNQKAEERAKFEGDLLNIDELDDPIQPYLDYIQWITTNYPSGVTVESGLIQVLERCTSHFRDVSFYKNDPRYLHVWLQYAKYSENPRDIFVYLARKEIGKSLATYYEEYANYLESNDRNLQADQVYQEGIKQEARPLIRLQKRYGEFKLRLESKQNVNDEPQSPVFPVRTVLSVKSGSLFSTHEEPRVQKRKLEVFSDPEGEPGLKTEGWDSLGTSMFRNKENKLEATSWAGEILKQDTEAIKKPNHMKISVFKDGSTASSGSVFKIIEVPGKKPEKIDLNFDLLYQDKEEFCIQEVLAIMRNIYDPANNNSIPPSSLPESPQLKSIIPHFHAKSQTNETIRLDTTVLKRKASPTATFFTKEAKGEILSMFNQRPRADGDQENQDEDYLVYEDYTEQITRPNINDLTERVSDLELQRRLEEEKLQEEIKNKVCVVNPGDESLKSLLLQDLSPSIETYQGLYNYSNDLEMCTTLKKSLNARSTRHVFLEFQGNGNTFNLISLLGEGGFASVYLAESMDGQFKALKAQKPSSAWEFYILKQIEQRLEGSDILDSIIRCDEMHLFKDESYLIMDYIKQGTILDVVNLYRSVGRHVDEVFVVFITIELLKVIEALHGVGIMHSDLKADNCMIRLSDSTSSHIVSQSWKTRGVKLIDFGRSIDMTLFPKNVQFKSNWKTDNQDCPEMRNNETWTYEVDYFGIAGIIHTMLYGSFIEITGDKDGYKLASPIKRYWKQELWNPLFDLLMNSKKFGNLPITNEIKEHRSRMEEWLKNNESNLMSAIRDIETGLK